MNKNTLLIIENTVVWAGVFFAFVIKILPLVQVMAGIAALIFSILSIIKILNNWNKK